MTTRTAELLARGAGWPATIAVTGLAAALRLPALTRPPELVFDETYYVKDAWTLLNLGYESTWPAEPNPAFEAGQVDGYFDKASYVVHPPVGKWVIALGLRVFGADDPVGWRIGVLVAGLVTVLLVTRVARRLFGSTALGVVAGTLCAIDGSAIVHSRIALLDGILAMWLIAAFAALLVDRDRTRARLARRSAEPPPDTPPDPDAPPDDARPDVVLLDDARPDSAGPDDVRPDLAPDLAPGAITTMPATDRIAGLGPRLGVRPFRILAGVLLGLAIGTKWSALWYLAVFGLVSVAWDASARWRAGVQLWWQGALVRDAVPAFVSLVGVAALTYAVSWTSWFTHPDSYGRQWAATQPDSPVPAALRSWWHYHQQVWEFHTNLRAEHPYVANPLGWLLQLRPTSFHYTTPEPPQQYCGTDHCSAAITSLGNPFIWWFATLALVAAIWWAVRRRDGIAGVVALGVLAGWLPWLLYADRPIFTFYAVAFLPFLILTLTWAVARLVAVARLDDHRRRWVLGGLVTAGVLVLATSAFFWPLWTAQVTPFRFWQLHMWLPSWV